jgi:hypothetical protein
VRTYYEIEETDVYLVARELLLRRCGAWAAASGLVMSLPLAGALLDSRYFSSDGRLGYWTQVQVRRALLEWIPEKVTAPEADLLDAPETLRTLLRYLDAHGLRDPRGAAIEENESAIDAVAKEFADAIGDQERYGMAKTVAMSAWDRGVDIGDPEALTAFLGEVRDGRLTLDEDLLGRALERQLGRPARARNGNSPSCLLACRPRRNSPQRQNAARLSGSSVHSWNGLARMAGPSRRPGTSGPRMPGS